MKKTLNVFIIYILNDLNVYLNKNILDLFNPGKRNSRCFVTTKSKTFDLWHYFVERCNHYPWIISSIGPSDFMSLSSKKS